MQDVCTLNATRGGGQFNSKLSNNITFFHSEIRTG